MKKLLISLFLFSFLFIGLQVNAVSDSESSVNNPIIFGVSGPQTLNINQTGTWKVEASDKKGGVLSYSVNWGDEKYHILPMGALTPSVNDTQQSATLTHSYSQPGIYQPSFTVKSENTIKCITTPCPSNSGSTKTSLTVKVSSSGIVCPTGDVTICPVEPPSNGCLPGYNYSPITGKRCVNVSSSTSTSSSQAVSIKRILRKGTKGDDVKKLQLFLNLISDGLFGSETQKKVMEWQMQNGLKVDGLFGRESVKKAGLDD